MNHTIHEQVKLQLEYLRYWIDEEIEAEKRCKEWNIPYTPSRRKDENTFLYNQYKKEIEQNGDKNLLVMVKMAGDDGINMYGIKPFARRYVNEPYLVYRPKDGGEILLNENRVEIVRR